MNKVSEKEQTAKSPGAVERDVLRLTSAALFNKEFKASSDTEWLAVYREICRHGIAALTFDSAQKLDVPKNILDMWSRERDRYILGALKNLNCHFNLHRMLSEEGIPYVILKGPASGSYYRDYLARAYGDVDFLVYDEHYDAAASFMESHGFKYNGEHDFHKRYSKGGMCYELHSDAPGLPANEAYDVLHDCLSDIIDSAVPFRYKSGICMIPCDRHHALVMIMHAANHMKNEGVGLRHLCDFAVFADRMGEEFFETELQDVLKRGGLWHFTKLLTAICTKYLGLSEFSFAKIEDEDYLSELMMDFFSSGNFGIKRSRETVAVRKHVSYSAHNKKSGSLRYLLKVFNDSASYAFPIVRRKPILKPGAFVYVGIRHLVRMVRGERSVEFTKALLTEDEKTREFIENWHLYEPEGTED